jgi:hypothetical protein
MAFSVDLGNGARIDLHQGRETGLGQGAIELLKSGGRLTEDTLKSKILELLFPQHTVFQRRLAVSCAVLTIEVPRCIRMCCTMGWHTRQMSDRMQCKRFKKGPRNPVHQVEGRARYVPIHCR